MVMERTIGVGTVTQCTQHKLVAALKGNISSIIRISYMFARIGDLERMKVCSVLSLCFRTVT